MFLYGLCLLSILLNKVGVTHESCEYLLRRDYVPGALHAGAWTTNKTRTAVGIAGQTQKVRNARLPGKGGPSSSWL